MMDRVFQMEFKRGFYSAGFYAGVILMAAAGLIGAGDVMGYLAEVEYIEGELRFSNAVFQAMCSEPFTFMLPIACTLAMSASYMEDLQSGMLRYIVLRTSKKKYRRSKVLNCALSGIMTAAAAVLILLVVFFVKYPLNGAEMEQLRTLGMLYHLYFWERVVIVCLNGAFYAVLGGLAASFADSRYLAYAAPFIFYYVISTLLDAYLEKFWLLNPRELLMARFMPQTEVLFVLAGLNMIVLAGYSRIIERRWGYE